MKILIVEDDDNSRQLLIDLLESQGHEVVSYENGLLALSYLQLNMVNLIISDILMPELDGFGLCRAVKQNLTLQDIPFIFYTATYTSSQDERFAMSLGAAAFLIKPMDLNAFLKVVNDVTSQQSKKLRSSRGRGLYRATPIKVDKQHTDIIRSKLDKKIVELNEERSKLLASQARLRDFAEASADWFWETDADLNLSIVSGGCNIKVDHLNVLASGCQNYLSQDLFKLLATKQPFSDFISNIEDLDGKNVFLRLSGKPIFDDDQVFLGYRGVGKDVSEMIALNRKVEFLSTHDVLTGLPGRQLLVEQIDRLIEHAKYQNEQFLVIYFDVDHFKLVNESFGLEVGDALINLISKRIVSQSRATDYLYRIGGDEFVMVIESCTPQEGHRFVREILDAFSAPFEIKEHRMYVTVSIGISVYADDATDTRSLLSFADIAMYKAKKAGGNHFEFYSKTLNYIPSNWVEMEQSIRTALHKNAFEIVYQPQINAVLNTVVGLEALLRWHDDKHGVVDAMELIKIAEQSALINYIDDWMIENVCRQIRIWLDDGFVIPKVSINISARHLRSTNLMNLLNSVPKKFNIPTSMICIEITEHAILEESMIVKENMSAIKNAGFSLSLDDFGTGHSSFLYLKQWAFDEVKIDRAFICDLVKSDEDKAIVKAMVALAKALDLDLIAEGVESQHQAAILLESGCEQMQGYHYAKPLSAVDVIAQFQPVH